MDELFLCLLLSHYNYCCKEGHLFNKFLLKIAKNVYIELG